MRRLPSPPWGRDEFDLYGIHGQARRADAGCLASSFGDASVDRRCFGDLRSGGSLAPLSPLGCVTDVVSRFSPAVCPLLPVRALISRTVCAPLCLAAWCCVSAFVLCCIVLCLESAALGTVVGYARVTLYVQHICLERVSCVLSLMVSTEKYFSIANARDEPHLPVSRARRRAVGSTVQWNTHTFSTF